MDELVDWCNQVDATYRSEFRELFDTRFALFDAKLDQRLTETEAELKTELARLETRLTLRMFLFWVGSVGLFLVQKL